MNDQAYTLRRIVRDGRAASMPQVIAVTSGKGGVGKTSFVINAAIILASVGKKVLILDADLGLANIDVMLGLTPRYNIQHVLDGECSLREIMIEGPAGIRIIPSASGIQELSDLSPEQQLTLVNALDHFDDDIDYMFVDTGAGISRNVMYFNAAAQRILVVATPEPTSITDAYALIKVVHKKYGINRFALVVNNVRSKVEGDEVAHKLSTVCEKFLGDVFLDMLGSIPHDSNISECIKGQKPFVLEYPNGEVAKRLAGVVKNLDRSAPSSDGGNLHFFMRRILLNEFKGPGENARHSFSRT